MLIAVPKELLNELYFVVNSIALYPERDFTAELFEAVRRLKGPLILPEKGSTEIDIETGKTTY